MYLKLHDCDLEFHWIELYFCRIKAQLSEANARFLNMSRDPNNPMSFGDRKSSYHHDLQLEELRSLQVTINNLFQDMYSV